MREVICWLLQAYLLVLFAYVIFSWVPRPPEPLLPVVRVVGAMVDPLVRPLRRIIPPVNIGGVSLSLGIIVLFFAVILLREAVCG